MENVVSIVEEFFSANKNMKILIRKEKVIISHKLFYSIILKIENSNKISVYPIWRIGVIGRLLFNKVYNDYIDNFNNIKNHLVMSGYDLSELHIVRNGMEFSFFQITTITSFSSLIKFN